MTYPIAASFSACPRCDGGVTETPDERADRLLQVALELIDRVRTDNPQATAHWLAALDPTELRDTTMLLACLVPEEYPVSALLAWWTQPDTNRLRPCGTRAAAERHRYHKEPLCDVCRQAEQARDRARKRQRRAAQAAA